MRERLLLLTQATYTIGVSAVVLNQDGAVLLLRNRFRFSNSWQLPGGFVGRGETLERAIQREMREETGMDMTLVRQIQARIDRPQHLDVCFLGTVGAQELILDRSEILDGKFFPIDALPPDIPADQIKLLEAVTAAS